MKWIRTVLLVVVALALGLWAYYGERHLDAEKAAEQRADYLVHFSQNDVKQVTDITLGDTIAATRQWGGIWSIFKPLTWGADNSAWESIIQDTRTSRRERGWHVSPDSMHVYGLDPPNSRIIFEFTKKDAPPDTIDIGSATPTGSRCYVRYPSKDTVYTTQTGIRSSAVTTLFNLRDRRVLPLEPVNVREFTIKQGHTTIDIARQDSGWTIKSPWMRAADPDTVNALLDAFKDARVSKFIDHPKSLAPYGLSGNPASIHIIMQLTGQTLDKSILFGSTIPNKESHVARPDVYIKDGSREPVMITGGNLETQMTRPAESYWDHRIVKFQRSDIDHVALVWPDSTISMRMDSTAIWRFDPPHKGEVKRWRVNTLVADADLARAKEFVSGSPATGLEHPRFSLRLYKGNDLKAQIDFGRTVGNRTYVKGSAYNYVVLADRKLINKFLLTTFDLRELPIPKKTTSPSFSKPSGS